MGGGCWAGGGGGGGGCLGVAARRGGGSWSGCWRWCRRGVCKAGLCCASSMTPWSLIVTAFPLLHCSLPSERLRFCSVENLGSPAGARASRPQFLGKSAGGTPAPPEGFARTLVFPYPHRHRPAGGPHCTASVLH